MQGWRDGKQADAQALISGRLSFMNSNWKKIDPKHIRAGGEIRQRMELTAEKILHHLDVEQVFVRHFRNRREHPEVPGGFVGYGMFLDAVVKAAAHGIGGAEMIQYKNRRFAELAETQSADGAITMFSGEPGRWDNHEQAYMIQAFVLDHRYFGCENSLKAALRLGNYLIQRKTSVNLGLETAFLMLTEESGDFKFARYCRDVFKIDESMERYDRIIPVNGVAHVYTWIARCLAQLQYADLTGNDSRILFDGTEELYRRVFSDYSSISGSCSGGFFWGEIWDNTQIGTGRWGETCVSAYLLRCTAKYLEFNPDAKLGDLYERILYNAFFGAQSEDGMRQRYFIPFNEPGEWFDRESYCCPNNLRRMMFELPDAIYYKTGNGIAINLYAESRLTLPGLAITQTTSYPESEEVRVQVNTERAFSLALRIPSWCTRATVQGNSVAAGWHILPLAAGKTEIAIHFPMEILRIRGTMAQSGRVALMRGPLVYALERELNNLEYGQVDLLTIDDSRPIRAESDGLHVPCIIPNMNHLKKEILFTRFSAEKRSRTYFPTTSEYGRHTDSLYGNN